MSILIYACKQRLKVEDLCGTVCVLYSATRTNGLRSAADANQSLKLQEQNINKNVGATRLALIVIGSV